MTTLIKVFAGLVNRHLNTVLLYNASPAAFDCNPTKTHGISTASEGDEVASRGHVSIQVG
jgi:hypothetical protein